MTLLRQLQVHGARTVAELAAGTGLHHNTAREHLHDLIDVGLVRADPIVRGGRGRPTLAYRTVTARDDPERGARAPTAGARVRGARSAITNGSPPCAAPAARQLAVLDDHMRQCGFDATIDPDGRRMTMHHCPVARFAKQNPEVCQAHLTLIKDALGAVAGPVRAHTLHQAFGQGECALDLVTADAHAA